MNFSREQERWIMDGSDLPWVPKLFIGRAQIHRIIEAVRNVVLIWALKLEEDGILGEGFVFSKSEKRLANTITYNITNIKLLQIRWPNRSLPKPANFKSIGWLKPGRRQKNKRIVSGWGWYA